MKILLIRSTRRMNAFSEQRRKGEEWKSDQKEIEPMRMRNLRASSESTSKVWPNRASDRRCQAIEQLHFGLFAVRTVLSSLTTYWTFTFANIAFSFWVFHIFPFFTFAGNEIHCNDFIVFIVANKCHMHNDTKIASNSENSNNKKMEKKMLMIENWTKKEEKHDETEAKKNDEERKMRRNEQRKWQKNTITETETMLFLIVEKRCHKFRIVVVRLLAQCDCVWLGWCACACWINVEPWKMAKLLCSETEMQRFQCFRFVSFSFLSGSYGNEIEVAVREIQWIPEMGLFSNANDNCFSFRVRFFPPCCSSRL